MKYIKQILFIATILILMNGVYAWSSGLNNGLKNYWAFDESSGTNIFNFANASMNGTSFNGSVFVSGKVGNAIQLNATPTQYFTTAPYVIKNSSNWSINFWAKLGNATSGDRIIMINSTAFEYATFNSLGTTIQAHWGGGAITSGIQRDQGVWQMYTFVYNTNADNMSIWQNGSMLTAAPMTGTANLNIQYFGRFTSATNGLNASLDEFGIWNRTLTATEIAELYTGATPTSTVSLNSPVDGAKIIFGNNTFNCSAAGNGVNVSNISIFHNITGTWALNFTNINPTNASSYSTLFGIDYGVPKVFDWTCQACFGDGSCAFALSNRTINYTGFADNGITYNPVSSSGNTEAFSWNVSISPSDTLSSAIFRYAGVSYPASILSEGGGNYLIFRAINVPTTQANYTFNFSLVASSGTYNSETKGQYVYNTLIDNCSTYTNSLLNFTMLDEETLLPINGTIEVTTNLYIPNTPILSATYNTSLNYVNGFKSGICINNITNNYTLSYTIKHYGNSSYFKKYRTIQSQLISNVTVPQNITLYNLLTTSGFAFTISITGTTSTTGLLVEAQKQYVAQNQFILIESAVTDSNSNVILHLIPQSEVYTFVVSLNGVVLGSFTPFKVSCQNPSIQQCSFPLNLEAATSNITDYTQYLGIAYDYLYSDLTKTLYFTFYSLNLSNHNVTQRVVLNDGYSNKTICYISNVVSGDTYFCPIPSVYQNSSLISMISVDGSNWQQTIFTLGATPEWFGVDIYIELLMFSSVVLMMISSPFLIIIGAILGLTFSVILLWVTGGTFGALIAAILFYIVAGIIVIWQIGRKT